jgi:anthranilate synthase component I
LTCGEQEGCHTPHAGIVKVLARVNPIGTAMHVVVHAASAFPIEEFSMNHCYNALLDASTEARFEQLTSEGFTKIPLIARRCMDFDTPLGIYRKLVGEPGTPDAAYSFLLESVVGGDRVGRYSFIGLPARTIVRTRGVGPAAITEVLCDDRVVETHCGNPLEFIEAYQKRAKVAVPPNAPRFCGGLCGYFGYDAVRYIESRLAHVHKDDALGTP